MTETVMRAEITPEFMERCGDGSLSGSIIEQLTKPHNPEETELVLAFHQTSFSWRKQHGGPDEWVMPEFAVMCLMRSVMHLVRQGYTVRVEEVNKK